MLWVITYAGFQGFGIISAVHATTTVRTSQGAIAWAACLLTMPLVAVPLYWVFGRNKFQGYVRARSEELQELDVFKKLAQDHARTSVLADDIDPKDAACGHVRSDRRPGRDHRGHLHRLHLLRELSRAQRGDLAPATAGERRRRIAACSPTPATRLRRGER